MAIFAKRWNDGLGTVSFIVGILTPPSAAEAITSAVTAEVENVRNALAAGAVSLLHDNTSQSCHFAFNKFSCIHERQGLL